MRKIITVLMMFISGFSFSQEEHAAIYTNEENTTSLIFSVDSIEELKTIKWDDVKEIFNGNSNKEKKIVLGFKVKNDKKDSKLKFKHFFEVKGKLSDIDGSIELARKMIKVIEKI